MGQLLHRKVEVVLANSGTGLLDDRLTARLANHRGSIRLCPFSFDRCYTCGGVSAAALAARTRNVEHTTFSRCLVRKKFPRLFVRGGGGRCIDGLISSMVGHSVRRQCGVQCFTSFRHVTRRLVGVTPIVLSPARLAGVFRFGAARAADGCVGCLGRSCLLVNLGGCSAGDHLEIASRGVCAISITIVSGHPSTFTNIGLK